tara:strand:+ start:267 stop:839 length:573 start_codon:yes stop_codon:yes gene_type:complete
LKIGVLSLQGAYLKHIEILNRLNVDAREVRYKKNLNDIDALIIPGGESTALTKLIESQSLYKDLSNFVDNKPVYGTCAGLILLSKKINGNEKVKSFKKLDISTNRNGWGRQVHSFIKNISIDISAEPFEGIFIRAPKISNCGTNVEVLSSIDNSPVMVKQNKILATTFHPELSNDTRIHKYFVDMVRNEC